VNVMKDGSRLDGAVDVDGRGCVVWDWRRGTCTVGGDGWDVALDHLDWDYRVVAPITPCGVAVIGDVTRYASAGRARVASVETIDGGVRLVVRGAGERVAITGWCDGEVGATAWTPSGGPSPVDVRRD